MAAALAAPLARPKFFFHLLLGSLIYHHQAQTHTPPAKKRSAASTARHAGTEDARHYLKEGCGCVGLVWLVRGGVSMR